ncbi:MAG: hypothetical protein KGI06_01365 [Candidatus Micrarchaeota archaeon]|nr:hypothetical protein [Candidatus Micrarchaeota archaeon]
MSKIDSTFKFDIASKFYETAKAWAKVRVKKDSKRGDYYIDVLIGSKGDKNPHAHIGINGDQSQRFFETRGIINTFSRKAVDSKQGLLDDRTINLKPQKGKNSFTFNVVIDDRTKTIKVLFKEAQLKPTT